MSMKSRFAAVALAALTIAGTFATSEAQARPRWGAIVGAGIATGLILGAAHAHAYPRYGYGYRRCHFVEKFDAWGHYIGTRKVCHVY